MGLFDDSLPDGWGRLLIDRKAVELGLSAANVTPLDRLTLVGPRSMGALVYEPETKLEEPTVLDLAAIEKEIVTVLDDVQGADLERLIAMGGSPKGLRPKLLVHMAPDGSLHHGARTASPGFTSWLVKFPSKGDDAHVSALEHAYFVMARRAGITVPETRVLAATKGIRLLRDQRFDRRGAISSPTHRRQAPPASGPVHGVPTTSAVKLT
jgi:serine/threonine-protein kinase HipA